MSDMGTGDMAPTPRQDAGQVTMEAKESGKQVAGSAAEQGRNVAHETRRQAQDLAQQARAQVDEQSRAQKDRAAGNLRGLADELQAMGSGAGGQAGIATDLAQQAATRVQDLAGWLDSREPGDVLDEVRAFARRRPGTFLLGALAAGVTAGRLTRGTVDTSRSDEVGAANDGQASGVTASADPLGGTSGAATYPPAAPAAGTPVADDLALEQQYTGSSLGGVR